MRITKFVHSCVLIETGNKAALFDPGNFSQDSGLIDVASLPNLDYLVITHEHPDHFHLPLVTQICERFPDLTIVTTESVAAQLKDAVKVKVITESDTVCEIFISTHENVAIGHTPDNIGVHFAGIFTHPGDSHSFSESKDILAMPMTAPWGSVTVAVKRIRELKPKQVVPIHDWHWRPEALAGMYDFIKQPLHEDGIDFIIPVDGQAIEA